MDLSEKNAVKVTPEAEALKSGSAQSLPHQANISPVQLASMIDHTCLKPEATQADICNLCDEAREFGFCSVCVNGCYASYAKSLLTETRVKLCCVVGFPLGAMASEVKAIEARQAIRDGAQEIDMVLNVGALKDGRHELVERDIRAVIEACREGAALCKVILETCLLTDLEKVTACELCVKAGADFVKTSTGFNQGGASVEDIALMARTVAPHQLGIKASGGVRTWDDAMRMIQAGATRIGASSSVNMIKRENSEGGSKY